MSDPTPEEMEIAKGMHDLIAPCGCPGGDCDDCKVIGRAIHRHAEEAVKARDREWTDALLGITKATITPGEADERVSRHYRDKINEAVKAATEELQERLNGLSASYYSMCEEARTADAALYDERQAREKADKEREELQVDKQVLRSELSGLSILLQEEREVCKKEVERLRRQNHESGAKRDAALRHREQKVEMFEGLQKYAREQHAKDMERQGKPPWSEITGFSARVAAEIISQRDAALAQVEHVTLAWRGASEGYAALREEVERLREFKVRHENGQDLKEQGKVIAALRKRVEELEAERDEVAAGVRTGAVDVAALCEQARREGAGAMREVVAQWLQDLAVRQREELGLAAEEHACHTERLATKIRVLPIDPPKAEPTRCDGVVPGKLRPENAASLPEPDALPGALPGPAEGGSVRRMPPGWLAIKQGWRKRSTGRIVCGLCRAEGR
jgi:hypothetical protein